MYFRRVRHLQTVHQSMLLVLCILVYNAVTVTNCHSVCRLLDAFERVAGNVPVPENASSALIVETTFAVSVQKVEPNKFTGLNVTAILGDFTEQRVDRSGLLFNKFTSELPTGSLSLPSNLLDRTKGTRITLSVFVTRALFLRRENNNTEVGSIIIAAEVVGTERVKNLATPIVAVFQRNPVSQTL